MNIAQASTPVSPFSAQPPERTARGWFTRLARGLLLRRPEDQALYAALQARAAEGITVAVSGRGALHAGPPEAVLAATCIRTKRERPRKESL